MTLDDIRLISYGSVKTKRFSYWVKFRDRRNISGQKARRDFINFFNGCFGPLGSKWQYSKYSYDEITLKIEDEKDLLIFLLKLK